MTNKFKFSYSAPSNEERKEIECIRNAYLQKQTVEENKLATLRKLDKKVKNTPLIIALSLGIIGTLIFGLGLTMILEWNIIILGVIIAALGLIFAAAAYPIYKTTFKHMKNKYSDQIIKLSEELLNNEYKQL